MKSSLFLLVTAVFTLLPTMAFAKLSCPEGTDAYINSENYEVICVPKGINPSELAAQQNGGVVDEQYVGEDGYPMDSYPEGMNGQPEYVENQEFISDENPVMDNELIRLDRYIVHDYENFRWKEKGAIGSARSGATLSLGMGYGFVAAMNLNLNVGYQFDLGASDVSFGIFFDANLKAGYPSITLDYVIEPSLIVFAGYFRFTLGLGLGGYLVHTKREDVDCYNYYDDECSWHDKEQMNNYVGFEIKPAFKFDWFMSENTWLGMGVDIPIMTSFRFKAFDAEKVFAWFDIYVRAGYKF